MTGTTVTIKAPLITSGTNKLINAIGYNKLDNYLWGHVSGTNQIIRIGSDGSTTSYTVTGLPVNTYTLGDVSPTGVLYLATVSSSSPIYRIALSTAPLAATASPAANTNGLLDWTMNPLDGLLYAMDGSTLYRYDPATGSYTTLGATGISGNASSQTYFDGAGNLYATGSGGTFRIATPTVGSVSSTLYSKNTLTIGTNSDAARCTDATATLPLQITQSTFNCVAGSPAYTVSSGQLAAYNPMTGTQSNIGTPLIPGSTNTVVNAMGFNAVDNYLWGHRTNTNQIVRIGSDGSAQTFTVSGLPSANYQLGDISPAGIYYLSASGGGNAIYRINLAVGPPYSATASPTTNTTSINDWAYSTTSGQLLGVDAGNGTLYSYNTTTGAFTNLGATGLPINSTTWNPFFDDSNNLYFAGPNGAYRIDNVSATSHTAYKYSNGTANTGQTDDVAGCRPDLPNLPVANPESVTIVSSTTVQINVPANDVADATYAGTTLDLTTVVITTQPSSGTVSVNPVTGVVTYSPTAGTSGNDTFVYTIKDSNGLISNPATVTVSVTSKPFDCPPDGIILGNGGLYLFSITTGVWTLVKSGLPNFNGVGYNQKDGYVWGSISNGVLGRIGADGSLTTFNVSGAARSVQGDISPAGIYYCNKEGTGNQLQIINLDPASPTYQNVTTVTITGSIPSGFGDGGDFSISPIDGNIYYVGASKVLYRINPTTGLSTQLGTVAALTSGQTYSTFMDDAGNFYLLDGNGRAWRLPAPHTGNVVAGLFSTGVPTSYGDGARCASAKLGPSALNDSFNGCTSLTGVNVVSNDSPGSSTIVTSSTRLIDPATQALVTTVTIAGQGTFNLNTSTGSVTFSKVTGFTGTASVSYQITDQNSLTATATITATVNNCSSVFALSGRVLNDTNGLTDNIVNGSGVDGTTVPQAGGSPVPIYVSIVQSGTVVSTVPVSNTGGYNFSGVPNGTYQLVLTTNPAGSLTPSVPAGWINTGENIGAGAGNDGTPDGLLTVVVNNGPITDANFGIEQLPTPGSGTNTVANAGGTTPVTVPANTFTNTTPSTDTAPGSVTAIRITAFPTNTTSLTVNGSVYTSLPTGGITVPTDGNGAPTVPILVDPTNDSSPVVFTFAAIDNAGKESTTTGTATINSSPLTTISGTVWDDVDGNVALNGLEIGTNAGGTLYVNLVNSGGIIVGSTTVATNGTYSLSGVPTNVTGYKLVLTNSASSTAPGGLPTGWVNTGESVDPSNTATQSTTLGQIELTTGTAPITGQNFGIEHLPTSGSGANTVANAGGTTLVTVPATTFTNSSPSSDAQDTPPGSVTAIRITALPSNTTSLVINDTTYNAGNFPGQGVTVPTDGSGNPTVPISVDPTNDANPVVIPFVAIDNAGKESTTTGTATINSTLVASVSGTVWNDADGNLSLNGSETGTNTGGTLYVNLVNGSNTVVGSATVAADGTYTLANVPTNVTGYKLVLTNSATSSTPGTLPTGWVNTGENVGSGNTAPQSTTLGQIELTMGSSSIAAQNFGIEQLPTPGSGANTVANAGGTSPVTVPANTFTNTTPSTDTAPGSVTAIHITAFPGNVTSLTINGTSYTAGTFPGTGITVPTDGSGNPTVPILLDPTNDANPVVITFVAVDNAGKESTTSGTATINSSPVVTVSGTVWNDADGSLSLNGSETGTNTGGTLYVNLVDGTGTLVGSTTVAANGTYSLTGVPANATGYKLVLTNTASSTAPGSLPTGWVNTGESVDPSNTATQSTTLGQIELTTGTSPVTGQNFGIELLPTAGSGSNTVSNAGGTSPVTVPANTFTNTTASTDTAPGSVTAIRLTTFPANVTSLTINGTTYTAVSFPGSGVTVPTDGNGNPTVPVLVDPTNDANPVVIPFVAIDNAGKESLNTGTATISSSLVTTVSGSVWNDADGSVTVNGSESGTNTGGLLYVNLVDGSGTVVGSTTVASNGTYSLTNVPTNISGYKLVLTNSAASTSPGTLPTGWVNTGDQVDPSNTATQSTTLGQIELTVGTSPVTAQNFGIEQLPSAGGGSNTVSNAGGTTPVTVPANTFTNATPSTDTAPGSVTAIRITSFPGNVTSLTINGSVYNAGNFPGAGITVPTDGSGNPTVPIWVDPTNDASPVAIPFVAIDNAGKASLNTGTATISAAPTVSLSGNVFDDANGLTDNSVNGTGVNGPSLPVYVSLVQAGAVIATVPVQANGSYTFPSVSPGSYSLVLTTVATGSPTTSLPASWSSTGENLGTGAVSDGIPDGVLAVTVGSSSLSQANFGIDQLPTANPVSQTYSNPGGTSQVQVPTLTGSDPEDGVYTGTSGRYQHGHHSVLASYPSGKPIRHPLLRR